MNTTRTPIPTPTIQQLRIAVENMDALAHEGFVQIAAIAKLAIAHLYSTDTPARDTITRAFGAIKRIAESQSESICAEAGATAPPPVAGAPANLGA